MKFDINDNNITTVAQIIMKARHRVTQNIRAKKYKDSTDTAEFRSQSTITQRDVFSAGFRVRIGWRGHGGTGREFHRFGPDITFL